MKINTQVKCALLAATALGYSVPAFAQDAPAAGEEASSEEIIVTGTLIRGIAPGGSQSIAVGQEKILAIGAANTSDLIGNIPQAGNFLAFTGVRGASNYSLAVNRPNLRYLGAASSSTASTLLLMDGHRMPGMGILQVTADLDAIPAGAIERVEIVTDGGSSTYGSDAVGGVMNFITRKTFDGVEARGGYGFGDEYQQANAVLTVGKAWDGGSAYVTYDYSWHSELYGRDRDWSRSLNWPLTAAAGYDVGAVNTCAPGNVLIGTSRYPLNASGTPLAQYPGAVVANQCDNSELATIYPRERKHSALASLLIDNGGPVSLSLKAFYVNRRSVSDAGPLTADITIRSGAQTNTNFALPPGVLPAPCSAPNAALNCETVNVSFANRVGIHTPLVSTMEAWGITPSAKWDVGGGWQVNAMFNYGEGKAGFIGGLLNATPIVNAAGPTSATTSVATPGVYTFDPFHLDAPQNAAVIVAALDWFQYGRAKNTLLNGRIVADGSLFELPGGPLKVAVGAEFTREGYAGITTRSQTAAGIATLKDIEVSRNIKSVFGELNIPIVGEGNRGFIYGLSLTASGRYDHYSDFGGTFNPKFGVNFQPVEWMKLRGTWGKAFQAPGLSDIAQIGVPSLSPLSTSLRPFFDPNNPKPVAALGHGNYILTIGGTLPGLKPQKATTWSLGLDLQPPVVPGLEVGMTYYNINFQGLISVGPINQPYFYKIFADKVVTWNGGSGTGTPAQQQAMIDYWNLLASPANGISAASKTSAEAAFSGDFSQVYAVMDGRTTNLGTVKTSGIDFYARYRHPTGFGDVYVDVAGTKILSYSNGGTTGDLDTWGFDLNNTFKLNTTIGAHIGNLQAQVTWQHTDGFRMQPSASNLQQSFSDGMNVFNLFVQYKVPGESAIAKDLTLSLNVDNIFDTDPALYRGLSNSLFGANGFTLGRVVKFSVGKRF